MKVRLRGQRLVNARHDEVELVLDAQRLADGVLLAKVFFGHRPRHQHRVRIGQSLVGIAADKVESQHFEQIFFRKKTVFLGELLLAVPQYQPPRV